MGSRGYTLTNVATPRPWQVLDTSIVSGMTCVAVIEEASEYAAPEHEQQANALLIIEAVNTYDKLRAENTALREALKQVSELAAMYTEANRAMATESEQEPSFIEVRYKEIIEHARKLLQNP